MTSIVKWEANLSSPINIRQGVQQGRFFLRCKRYNNPLLLEVENRFTGAQIGYIKISHVTVADDLPADFKYTMGGEQVQQENQTKHLGILRDASQRPNIRDKISLDRRIAYSLMGEGWFSQYE